MDRQPHDVICAFFQNKHTKNRAPKVITFTSLKMEQSVMHPKDADGMANSVDPDQTAP